MTQRFFVDPEGNYLGSFDGPEEALPALFLDALEVPSIPESGPTFKPIEPAPFWIAAWDLLKLDEEAILSVITDVDEQREARVEISKRKTYLRDDPMVLKLMDLMGYDKDQMDTMWLFVQENYK